MPAQRDDLLSVQALRAIAALLVVAYHAVDQWGTHVAGRSGDSLWPNGSAGVDIFFVISGVVMTISARRVAGRPWAWLLFMRQRLTRIVPLYWVVTTAKVAAVLVLPALVARTQLDLPYVAASYALWPVRDWTGEIRPVLPVGWTLSYEMLFYLLVAVALVLRLSILRIALPALLVFAGLAVAIAADGDVPGFANTIALEFLFGVAIGLAIHHQVRLPVLLAAAMLAGGLLAIVLMPAVSGLLRPLTWGGPAFCIVAGAVALEPLLAPALPRWLLAAGNASYSTYLTHGFVVPLVFLVVARAGVPAALSLPITLIGGLLVSGLAGQATYAVVERPLLHWFRRRPAIATVAVAG